MHRFPLRRPLYFFALVFFATVSALLHWGEIYGIYAAVAAGIVFLFSVSVAYLRRFGILIAVSLAVLTASLSTVSAYYLRVYPMQKAIDTTAKITVKVCDLPEGDSTLYHAVVLESSSIPKGSNIGISFANPALTLQKNQVVKGKANLYSYGSGNTVLNAYFKESVTVGAVETPWYERALDGARNRIVTTVTETLSGEEGGVVAGVLLGDTSQVTPEVEKAFRDSGLSHLLVVSGLHMTVVTGAVYALLCSLRAPRWLVLLLTLGVLWTFMLLVGLSYSVIRAAVMLHFVLFSEMVRWRADSRTSLGAALLLILTADPYAAEDVGFLLSFSATLGIVVLTPVLEEICARIPVMSRHPRLCKLVAALFCPVSALMFTAPVSAMAFHRMTLLAPFSNLLTMWPTTILLPLGSVAAILILIPGLGVLANAPLFITGLLAKWVIAVARWFSKLSVSSLQIRNPVLLILLLLFPLLVYWCWKWKKGPGLRRAAIALTALLVACYSLITVISRTTVSVRIDNTETGLTAVIEHAGHHIAVISGKTTSQFYEAYRFLSECGVERLDALIVTQGNTDVTARLSELLSDFPADVLICPETSVNMTVGLHHKAVETVKNEAAFTLWEDTALYTLHGWWRVDVGNTRFLFAPVDGTTAQLPKDWKNAHLAVFHRYVPDGVSLLNVREAVMICDASDLRAQTGKLPWGTYPIHIAFQCDDIAYMTTGKGDMITANEYWL